jgi:hypothetical protein
MSFLDQNFMLFPMVVMMNDDTLFSASLKQGNEYNYPQKLACSHPALFLGIYDI